MSLRAEIGDWSTGTCEGSKPGPGVVMVISSAVGTSLLIEIGGVKSGSIDSTPFTLVSKVKKIANSNTLQIF